MRGDGGDEYRFIVLQTVLSTLLEDLLFDLPEVAERRFVLDEAVVRQRLMHVVEGEDLREVHPNLGMTWRTRTGTDWERRGLPFPAG